MEGFNSDLVLSVVQYLNASDAGRLAASSKRYYYLVHQYRKLSGPGLVASSGWDPSAGEQLGSKEVVRRGIDGLQKIPNLVLAFGSLRSGGGALGEELARRFNNNPETTVVLGAIAGDIQVNRPSSVVEHESDDSAMFASFPNARVIPFVIEHGGRNNKARMEESVRALHRKLGQKDDDDGWWKAVIVYACGRGSAFVETFVSTIQKSLPGVAIVGGICAGGYVSSSSESESESEPPQTRDELAKMTVRQLKNLNRSLEGDGNNNKSFLEKSELVDHVFALLSQQTQRPPSLVHCEDAVFGVVLGGDAPVRSVVSRGVESVLQGGGPVRPTSPFVVEDAELSRPGDDSYFFRGVDDLKAMHTIRRIRNTDSGKVLPATELIARVSQAAEFIGFRRPGEDGFELHMITPYCLMTGNILVVTNGSTEETATLRDAEIDFFRLAGDACLADMDATVAKLKRQTGGEKILGAVMYTCNGRGPRGGQGGLIAETMADATRFSRGFPGVPCLGFYAGGEIGPLAVAGSEGVVFRTGRATVQGFTAVFALFIVPDDPERPGSYQLDDCEENVLRFVRTRLNGNTAGGSS